MPRAPKMDARSAGKKAREMTPKEKRKVARRLIESGIQDATGRAYASCNRQMREYLKASGQRDWDADLFTLFLGHATEAGLKSAERFRSALIHKRMCDGKPYAFLQSDDIRKMTQGVRLQAVLRTKSRGTVTRPMFDSLIGWLRQRGKVWDALLATVIYGAQLRISEAIGIRAGDFQADASGGKLLLRKDKRQNRTTAEKRTFEKVIPRGLLNLLQRLAARKCQGERLFESKQAASLRAAIKEAAGELQWPTDVVFDGPHVLRHGGTERLRERAAETLATGFAQQSRQTFRRYGRSNVERAKE